MQSSTGDNAAARPDDDGIPLSEAEAVAHDNGDNNSEGSGEDILNENMMADYGEMAELDRYDENILDNRDYGDNRNARMDADREMEERDAREGRGRRGRGEAAMESETEERSEMEGFRERRKRTRRLEDQATAEDAEEEPDEPFNLETFKVPLRKWVDEEHTKKEIKRRFRNFLETYVVQSTGERIHEGIIDATCAANGQSLPISYLHLSHHSPVLAIWLADVPKQMLAIFDDVAKAVVAAKYPDYARIHDEIHVRITNLPIVDSLRDLRQVHLNALIKISGVVTRRTGVFPQLKVVKFNCGSCGAVVGPFVQREATEVKATTCPECQSHGPFSLNHEQTLYRNYQKITVQESPGSVPAGRVPRYKDVILLADLIDAARPGEEVEVTGVYSNTFDAALNIKQGFPVFATVIEANYVLRRNDSLSSFNITEDDKREIEALAKDPNILQRVVNSIAPSIYGNEQAKLAAALAMFGGREKNVNNKHRIRGDINVLLLGDPGTAKSQVLKYIEKTAPRAVYTTGKGASAVGLTAAVHKDPLTGEWTLEGGALVLADQGVCLIDEFDKMNDQDRTSIHEAMEQQSISISKAGIVTTLNARCSVIAAANPIGGRYDVSKTFSENVQLTDPILTRFDILCVLRDEADPVLDEKLATFVVESHSRSHPRARAAAAAAAAAGNSQREEQAQPAHTLTTGAGSETPGDGRGGAKEGAAGGAIRQELLKKYIIHAKSVKPSLTRIDQDKVARLYADLRKESEYSNGIPIAVRHIESILRMTEASARIRLSPTVSEDDLNLAIRVMLESFISAQKHSATRALRRQFRKYLDMTADYHAVLLSKLRELVKEKQALAYVRAGRAEFLGMDAVDISFQELVDRGVRSGVPRELALAFVNGTEFEADGFRYDGVTGTIHRENV